jgi:hypothetical protein
MFSGLQELLLIGLIIACLFLLPRMMQRGRQDAAGTSAAVRRGLQIPRSLRLAVVLSAIWLMMSIAYFQPWRAYTSRFLYVGIVPIAAAWGIIWIAHGRRNRRTED